MTDKNTAPAAVPPAANAELVELQHNLPAIIEQLPDPEDNGADRIMLAILSAESPEAINDPYTGGSMGKLKDHMLEVHEVSKLPSDRDTELGYYLLVRGWDYDTDKQFTASTSARAIIAALVRLWMLQALPCHVIVRKADRATARGFFPEHLEYVGK